MIIAHWKLNDNAASATVIDNIGNHNGTYKDGGGNLNTSTGASTGRINGALDFDGTDEYVEITDHADFTPALTPFSISSWVFMHDATNFRIASKGVFGVDGEWSLRLTSSDFFGFLLADESVDNCHIGSQATGALTSYENQWIHLVGTYDGGILSSGIKLYVNGNLAASAANESNAGSFVSVENLTHAVWIGRSGTGFADGLIDNVMIFDKALTVDDVKILYSAGHGTEILADLDESRRIKRRPIWQR